jgi:hypothetical protein
VVQRFPELHRINKRMAVDVGPVMFMQIMTGEHEGRYLLPVLPEPDVREITAHADKECPSKDVRGLKAGCCQKKSPPFLKKSCHQNVTFITNQSYPVKHFSGLTITFQCSIINKNE